MVKKIIIAVVLVLLIGGGSIYWSKNGGSILRSPPVIVKMGSGPITAPEAFLAYIIDKYEFDKKNGIDIQFVHTPDPGENQRRFRDGEVDMAWTPFLTAAQYFLDGRDVRIIGPMEGVFIVHIVRANSPFKTFEDLKGGRFGVTPKVTANYSLSLLQMKEMGLDLNKDFKVVFGNHPDLQKFLLNGDIDFYAALLDVSIKLTAEGKAREIASLGELWQKANGRSLPFIGVITTQKWIDAHKGVNIKVVKAYFDAVNYVHTHPGIWEEERNYLGIKTDAELDGFKLRYASFTLNTSWNNNNIDDVKYLYTKAIENGLLKSANFDTLFIPFAP